MFFKNLPGKAWGYQHVQKHQKIMAEGLPTIERDIFRPWKLGVWALNPCLYCVYGLASLRSLITAAAGNPVTPHTWFTIGDPRKACGPIMNPGKAWGIRPGRDWGYAFITAKSEHLHRCEPSLKAPMDQGGFCGRVSSVRKRRVMPVYPDVSSAWSRERLE